MGLGCDVASEESVKATFGAIKEKFGRIDVSPSRLYKKRAHNQTLVTAAGIVENYVAHDYPTEKIRKLLDINVMGTWFCALEAAKLMPEGGSMIMIGSMSGSVCRISLALTRD
jgi:D-arabinitol 2-dehydrogenase